jgi:hypothetical protein
VLCVCVALVVGALDALAVPVPVELDDGSLVWLGLSVADDDDVWVGVPVGDDVALGLALADTIKTSTVTVKAAVTRGSRA